MKYENKMIYVKKLNKSYTNIKAVDDLSFNIKKGELFAFLGVNGAGKSTTINIICGQLSKDSGDIFIDGYDLDKDVDLIKRKIGVVFQESLLDMALTVKENLCFRACLYGISGKYFSQRLDTLCELLDLTEIVNRPIKELSGGQRRRADIARALVHDPEILILDEPTTGLDPQTRKTLWNVISSLREEKGMTVFLTTHYMEEAADADHVVIIDSGKIVAEGTPVELKNKYTGDYITLYNTDQSVIEKLNVKYEKFGTAWKLFIKSTTEATKLIVKNPEVFKDYEITMGKMDDVFLAVTGKRVSEEDKK